MPLKPHEQHALLAILQDIQEQLTSLNSLLRQTTQQVKNADGAEQSGHQDPASEADGLRWVVEPSDGEKKKQESTQAKAHGLHKIAVVVNAVVALATTAAFGAAVWYACIAEGQRKIMSGQLEKMDLALKESAKQTEYAKNSLEVAKDNFRRDERPYIALGPAGDTGNLHSVQTGVNAGHVGVEIHLGNYGKSPGIEIARDARLAIGANEARRIGLRDPTDRRGRIIPPNDRPSLYAYSDRPVTQAELNEIMAGHVLVILYGHIDYTDLFSEPKPRYVTEFCTGILQPRDSTGQADQYCRGHTQMK